MRNIAAIFLVFLMTIACQAQDNSKIENIPPYHIQKADSTYVTPANLKKNKPVMIIYFSPDCSHCQALMSEMKPELKQFKDVQIVMIAFTPFLKMLSDFSRDYGLNAYPNITVGTEGYTYVVQRYYQIKTTPFIAVYDHKGKLLTTYEHPPKVSELVKTVKKA